MKVLDILAEVDLKYPNDVEKAHILGWITTLEKQLLDVVPDLRSSKSRRV